MPGTGLRKIQIEELIKELRGPRDGINEILSDYGPLNEYLTGIIIPVTEGSEEPVDNIENNDSLCGLESKDSNRVNYLGEGDDFEPDDHFLVPNELNPKNQLMSFGLSFFVSGDNPAIQPKLNICVTWGRYIESKIQESEENSHPEWTRIPYLKYLTVDVIPGNQKTYPDDDKQIEISLKVLNINDNGKYHVFISMINRLGDGKPTSLNHPEKNVLFQPQLRINVVDGKLVPKDSDIKSELEYISKDSAAYARGHMCAAIWKSIDYTEYLDEKIIWPDGELETDPDKRHEFYNCDLRSEFLPLSDVLMPDFNWSDESQKPVLDAKILSETWDPELIKNHLNPIYDSYRSWILKNKNCSTDDYSKKIIDKQEECLNRIKKGIDCIINDEKARLSFCFANRVLVQVNKWKHKNFIWRPFQIAFFLVCLESVYNENSDERDKMDLLWVSTGGGKTEAYLGLMAFAIASRRIKSKSGLKPGYDENGSGVSIITRYTLRLLAIQQFRRTLTMITAAEYLRVIKTASGNHGWRPDGCTIDSDWIYGETRYSVGLLVGSGVTPNTLRNSSNFSGAIKALEHPHDAEHDSDPAHVLRCPVCDEILTIPRRSQTSIGLSENKYVLHLIIRDINNLKRDDFDSALKGWKYESETATVLASIDSVISEYVYSLKIDLHVHQPLDSETYDNIIMDLKSATNIQILSFTASSPGYFPLVHDVPHSGKKSPGIPDFEIYCPNPKCDLNSNIEWDEKLPLKLDSENPLFNKHFMPIPAYTVDEQVYHKCPTIILSTVDKIARFAFDPQVSTIFGNVKYYNQYYGYLRDKSNELPINKISYYPKYCSKEAFNDRYICDVKPFAPPDMVVQDELHLLDGPLGSMFGLYELMIRSLFYRSGGKVKYISSSATVNKAEKQIKKLFNASSELFPPYGIKADDSFFVRLDTSHRWNENKPGRVYMGVLCPGKGVLTPNIRIWTRLINTEKCNIGMEHYQNFQTIVGYCNSMRELGGLNSLYHDDMVERYKQISKDKNSYIGPSCELSSRLSSSEIPMILDSLESEGSNGFNGENKTAVFTTSMFGTGVDIPHLSLMVVNGQPKTTAQYIQATGRVGRNVGALIVTLFKPGKPRDLSHYELFSGYHQALNLSVEQVSVSPYSTGCLDRAASSIMVSFFRNAPNMRVNWKLNDGSVISSKDADDDKNEFISNIKACCDPEVFKKVELIFNSIYDLWKEYVIKYSDDREIVFSESAIYNSPSKNVVLGDTKHPQINEIQNKDLVWSVFKNTPTSLRDVESTTGFGV